mmetsp:Transcript_4289/g.12101  ORF Transcript_4289/g.12101 Transcript_4289/m.12101 type:complete len:376 (+) Transcript_4289:329-1456(+)
MHQIGDHFLHRGAIAQLHAIGHETTDICLSVEHPAVGIGHRLLMLGQLRILLIPRHGRVRVKMARAALREQYCLLDADDVNDLLGLHVLLLHPINDVMSADDLSEARIALLVQVVMLLPSGTVDLRIVLRVDVKLHPARSAAEAHRVGVVRIVLVIFLEGQLGQSGLDEGFLPRFGRPEGRRDGLDDVIDVMDKGVAVPQLVVDRFQKVQDGVRHEGDGGQLDDELVRAGFGHLGNEGPVLVHELEGELHPVRSLSEAFDGLHPANVGNVLLQPSQPIPQRLLLLQQHLVLSPLPVPLEERPGHGPARNLLLGVVDVALPLLLRRPGLAQRHLVRVVIEQEGAQIEAEGGQVGGDGRSAVGGVRVEQGREEEGGN